jgi:hypothetical protein
MGLIGPSVGNPLGIQGKEAHRDGKDTTAVGDRQKIMFISLKMLGGEAT